MSFSFACKLDIPLNTRGTLDSHFLCVLFCLLFRGNTPESRGTAYVVYEDIFDAKNACDHLSGFNVCNRYLVVLYYNANRVCISIRVSVGIIWSKGNDEKIQFLELNNIISREYKHIYVHAVIPNLIKVFSVVSTLFAGFPKNGHKEERGTAEASEREIWHQHRPSKVACWKLHPAQPPFSPSFQKFSFSIYSKSFVHVVYAGNDLLIQTYFFF